MRRVTRSRLVLHCPPLKIGDGDHRLLAALPSHDHRGVARHIGADRVPLRCNRCAPCTVGNDGAISALRRARQQRERGAWEHKLTALVNPGEHAHHETALRIEE